MRPILIMFVILLLASPTWPGHETRSTLHEDTLQSIVDRQNTIGAAKKPPEVAETTDEYWHRITEGMLDGWVRDEDAKVGKKIDKAYKSGNKAKRDAIKAAAGVP